MKLNAVILNSSDKVLSRFVALGEGDLSVYGNLVNAGLGSTYLDKLNKVFYQRMDSTGEASDWVKLAGSNPTKMGVFPMSSEEIVLERPVYTLQENIEVGTDDIVRGKLKYIESWEEFSSIENEQSGHYLSLLIPRPTGTTTVKVQKDAGEEKTIKSDDIVVRLDSTTKKLKITVTTDSGSLTRTLDLSKLEKL